MVAPEGAGTIVLRINEVRVIGGSVYSSAELAELYAGLLGREVVLAEVYALAQQLTAKYGDDGYVLSRAIVPPQDRADYLLYEGLYISVTLPAEAAAKPKLADIGLKHYTAMWPIGQWLLDEVSQG